jgi:hypothetical protein
MTTFILLLIHMHSLRPGETNLFPGMSCITQSTSISSKHDMLAHVYVHAHVRVYGETHPLRTLLRY